MVRITDEEALHMGRELVACDGVLAGISSGAAVSAAVHLACREENKGKLIVVLLPDTGERYLSTELFAFRNNILFRGNLSRLCLPKSENHKTVLFH